MSGTVGTVLIREVPRSEGVLYKVVPPLMDGKVQYVCTYVCTVCITITCSVTSAIYPLCTSCMSLHCTSTVQLCRVEWKVHNVNGHYEKVRMCFRSYCPSFIVGCNIPKCPRTASVVVCRSYFFHTTFPSIARF